MSRKKAGIDFGGLHKEALGRAGVSRDADDAPPVIRDEGADRGYVGMSFRVSRSARQEMKEWAVRHEMTLLSVLTEGFRLMKEKYGP